MKISKDIRASYGLSALMSLEFLTLMWIPFVHVIWFSLVNLSCAILIASQKGLMGREEIPYPPPTVDILDGSDGKESACNAGDLGWEDPLEKRIATHSSILSYYIVLGIRA